MTDKKVYDTFGHMSLYIPHDNGKSSSLNFGLVDNRPRITAFFNDVEGSSVKYVNIKLTYLALSGLLGLIKKATEMEEPDFSFSSFDTVFTDGKRTDEVAITGIMKIVRNNRKQITLVITTQDTKEYAFPLAMVSKWHQVKKGDKVITDSASMSNITAVEFAKMLSSAYAHNIWQNRYTKEK